jgi:hypothetical protein
VNRSTAKPALSHRDQQLLHHPGDSALLGLVLSRTSTLTLSSTRSYFLTTHEKSRATDLLSWQSFPREDRTAGPPENRRAREQLVSASPYGLGFASQSARISPVESCSRVASVRCPAGITITQPAEYRSVRIRHLRQLGGPHGPGDIRSFGYCTYAKPGVI